MRKASLDLSQSFSLPPPTQSHSFPRSRRHAKMSIPPNLNIGELTIPLFVGTVLNWALLGVLLVQVYLYFTAFPTDQRINRIVVLFAIIADGLQTFGDTRNTIRSFGTDWGNLAALDEVGLAWFSVPILGTSIACVGQLFFAWRIYIISNGAWYVPAVLVMLVVFEFGAGLWTGILIAKANHFSRLTFEALKPPVAWLSATAAADLIIVAATVYYLLRARQPGFRGATYVAVNRIIRVTIETGIPCAVFALIDLALFVAFNGNNIHLGTCIWLSKVYSNSILAILNSRMSITHGNRAFEGSVNNISEMAFSNGNTRSSIPPRVTLQLDVSRGTGTTSASISEYSPESRRTYSFKPPAATYETASDVAFPLHALGRHSAAELSQRESQYSAV
ncbi:hypothetical protein MKEN_01365000 [Mycena kentingensis (nom. inval.)]|nr:hypothetical protein MKEN_01365000 [Mycena kentingensis (nom. inval.)]